MLKYEIKKLLGNKFILFFFVLLFFINGVLTYYGIPRAGEGGRLYKEDWQNRAATFDVYNADPESFVEEMKISYAYYKQHTEVSSKMVSDMMITGVEGDIHDYWPEYNDEIKQYCIDYQKKYMHVRHAINYAEELPARYDEVIERAKISLAEFSALGVPKNSYNYRYQQDIIDLYSANRDIPLEIEMANGWDEFFGYTNGNLCLMLFLIILVPGLLLDEHKNGTASIIRAARHGRVRLMMTKYIALLTVITFAVLTFSLTSLILYGAGTYGFSSLTNNIQVFSTYLYCPYEIPVWAYLAVSLLIKILALFALGSLVMALSLLIKNYILTFLGGFLICGVNFIIYFFPYININHPLRLMNLFTIMDTEVCFSRYYAINVFGWGLPYLSAILLMLGGILLLTAILSFWQFCRIPGAGRSRFKAKKLSLPGFTVPCPIRTTVGFELYKHLVAGKYILLIAAVLLIKLWMVEQSAPLNYSYSDDLYKEYMLMLEGPVTEEKLQFIQDEREEITKLMSMEEAMKEKYANREITLTELILYQDDLEEAKIKKEVFVVVEAQRDYLVAQRDQGVNVHFVYTTGWNALFSQSFDYILFAFTVVFSTLLFTSEYSAGISGILRSSKGGRRRLFAIKYATAGVLCSAVAIVFAIIDYNHIVGQYLFTAGTSPAQSVPLLGAIGLPLTLQQYLVLYEIMRILGLLILGLGTVSASVLMEKPIPTMAPVATVTVIPYVFRRFGLDIAKYLDYTDLLEATPYMTRSFEHPLYFILFTGCTTALFTALFAGAYRRWNRS